MVRERITSRRLNERFILAPSVLSAGAGVDDLFPGDCPLEVDVGCGRGRFLLARARQFPGRRFVGLDRSLKRLHKLDRRAEQAGIENIRLIRGEAVQLLQTLFPPASVATFYVFFPDPWPKRHHHIRRLVQPAFLDLLHALLRPEGHVHLATDHADYFALMHRLLHDVPGFEEVPAFVPVDEEETDFGMLFRQTQRTIKRCSFRKRSAAPHQPAPRSER